MDEQRDGGPAETLQCYGAWMIYRDPPPIPDRSMDWHFYHVQYDGAGDGRCGSAASLEACKREIDMIEAARKAREGET